MRWVAGAVGVVVVFGTATSVLYTLVIPRAYPSRLSVFISRRVVRRASMVLADRFSSYETKDRILSLAGPISLLSLFLGWLLLYLVGYALVGWPLSHASFLTSLRESGSSVFTVGFMSSALASRTVVDFCAAATGLFVIALEIAYLPTLYGAFNRREVLVTMLQSRAGVPAWGPEILARHQLVHLVGNLPALYADWEQWAADVAESHTNYVVLMFFRSPHPLRSWVIALLAVLDSAALYLALSPDAVPKEARLCLRMGFVALRDIADVLSIPYDPDPIPGQPIQLPYEEYLQGVNRITEIGFPTERTPEEAWPHFVGWRLNYESIAYELAYRVGAPPAPWSGPRRNMPTITPARPLDRTPQDPQASRSPDGRWRG